MSASSIPIASTRPDRLSTVSSIDRHSIWKPPQMPSTARPEAACVRMAWSRPRSRIQPKSATVDLVPGTTITSVSAKSAGSRTQRTSTPGSQASASTSVELEIRGNRSTAIRSHWYAARRSRCAQYAVRQYRDRVLGVEPQIVGVGQHPVGGTAAEFGELAQPGFQQRDVAAEFVHDESGDQRLIVGVEHGHRPEQVREQPAAIDVADDDHRQVRGAGQTHVHQVRCTQVYFSRRTGALADHHVEFGS